MHAKASMPRRALYPAPPCGAAIRPLIRALLATRCNPGLKTGYQALIAAGLPDKISIMQSDEDGLRGVPVTSLAAGGLTFTFLLE
jgi:hypothetical protein